MLETGWKSRAMLGTGYLDNNPSDNLVFNDNTEI
jgi:hypothetical protein